MLTAIKKDISFKGEDVYNNINYSLIIAFKKNNDLERSLKIIERSGLIYSHLSLFTVSKKLTDFYLNISNIKSSISLSKLILGFSIFFGFIGFIAGTGLINSILLKNLVEIGPTLSLFLCSGIGAILGLLIGCVIILFSSKSNLMNSNNEINAIHIKTNDSIKLSSIINIFKTIDVFILSLELDQSKHKLPKSKYDSNTFKYVQSYNVHENPMTTKNHRPSIIPL